MLKSGVSQMDEASIRNTYKRYAGSYDKIFGPIFENGRRQAVEKMCCVEGDRILEVGVGTGLAMHHYPPYTRVFGIDISPHMLSVAKRNINSGRSMPRVSLALMDAQNLCFPDNFFSKISAMYVATVVPDPELMMNEIKRVCRPEGDIFILNHFSNSHLLPGLVESMLTPFQKVLGFRPRFSMDRFVSENDLEIVDTARVNLFGYWTLIHAKNRKPQNAGASPLQETDRQNFNQV